MNSSIPKFDPHSTQLNSTQLKSNQKQANYLEMHLHATPLRAEKCGHAHAPIGKLALVLGLDKQRRLVQRRRDLGARGRAGSERAGMCSGRSSGGLGRGRCGDRGRPRAVLFEAQQHVSVVDQHGLQVGGQLLGLLEQRAQRGRLDEVGDRQARDALQPLATELVRHGRKAEDEIDRRACTVGRRNVEIEYPRQ